jgi:hypothetical protein
MHTLCYHKKSTMALPPVHRGRSGRSDSTQAAKAIFIIVASLSSTRSSAEYWHCFVTCASALVSRCRSVSSDGVRDCRTTTHHVLAHREQPVSHALAPLSTSYADVREGRRQDGSAASPAEPARRARCSRGVAVSRTENVAQSASVRFLPIINVLPRHPPP